MSTRQRKNPQLPPPRRKKALRTVSPPLSNTRLATLVYYLAAGALVISAFYVYRLTQWKANAGGWWNLFMRTTPQRVQSPRPASFKAQNGPGDVEDRINALADILGIQPTLLASAISGAVKQHVAPATLASISSSASAAGAKMTAVDALVGESLDEGAGLASGLADSLGRIVGLDEPLELD